MKKDVKGNKLKLGIVARLSIQKNRLTGREWTVKVPIYNETGIDDVGSCVDFLVDWKHWKKDRSGVITAPDLDFKGQRSKLIQHIEQNDMEVDLRAEVVEQWMQVVEACKVERKRRYE